MELKTPHKHWLDGRGIDPNMAEKLGLHTVLRGDAHWLAVPYVENGKTVNHKYRVTSDKRRQLMDDGAPLTLWNHDCLLDESLDRQPLILTEGEWDALVCLTAGKRRVVSVPNGAPNEASDDDRLVNGNRYQWFWRLEPILSKVRKVILAVDGDAPGQALAADLCRLFGPERCAFVTWPEGCKDANDVVDLHGHDELIRILDNAKDYPIKGLFRLSDFPEFGEMRTFPLGVPGLSGLVNIVPESLTILTGYPGQGKTSLTMAIVAHQLRNNVPVCLGTFETLPKPILQRRLRAAILQCGEHQIPRDRIAEADALIERNLTIIAQMVGEDDEMTLEEILERARVAVFRDGAQMLIIDPWNEVEHKRRPEESETEYIGRALRAIKTFMREHRVAVWIVAHPRSPGPNVSKRHVPGLLDISGSAHWANKPDYGVIVSRPDKETNLVDLYVTKVRMGYPGKEGKVTLAYDFRVSGYTEAEREREMA